MSKIHWLVIVVSFIAGFYFGYLKYYIDPSFSGHYALLNESAAASVCQGIHDQAAEDIAIFCHMLSKQLDEGQCERTEFVRHLKMKLDPVYMVSCRNALSTQKPNPSTSTSSKDFAPSDFK